MTGRLGGTAGIAFAIPSDTATSIARQLITAGKVTNSGRASLGIIAQTVVGAADVGGGRQAMTNDPEGPD